ncbi:hypothetical protein [Micromonospora sp. NPDC005806]|uniref:hypothetical protein n=1 Tax=Micromonospora sp. NPDC005806 TaxID=3364234 RepID=UPI0036C90654
MLDVPTIGRVGVDSYPLQIGTPLAEVETSGRVLGGSPTNVAFADYVHRAQRDLQIHADELDLAAVTGARVPEGDR